MWVPDWNAQKIEPGLQRIGQSSRRGRELSKRSRSAWANKSASHLLRQLWIIIGRIIFFAVSTLFKDIRLGKSKGKAFVCPVQKGAGTSPENRNKINYIMFTKACPRDIKKTDGLCHLVPQNWMWPSGKQAPELGLEMCCTMRSEIHLHWKISR